MTPADAEAFNVTNGQIVKVSIRSARTTIFDDVVVRVSPNYALAMHIDTDECNAAAAFRHGVRRAGSVRAADRQKDRKNRKNKKAKREREGNRQAP